MPKSGMASKTSCNTSNDEVCPAGGSHTGMTTPSTTGSPQQLLIPYHHDPLAELAERINHDQQNGLPDLSKITVLLPDNTAARYLRRQLLSAAQAAGQQALLGPHILTLGEWVRQFLPDNIQVCDDQSRELQLVEALLEQTDLLGGANPWSLSESLMQLFDELTLNQIRLPEKLDAFTQQLAAAYSIDDTSLQAFSHEARIVYTLWRAWQQQLQDNQQVDATMAYVLALNHALQQLGGQTLYLAGYAFLSKTEQDWLAEAKQQSCVTVTEHVRPSADESMQASSAYSQCSMPYMMTRVYHYGNEPCTFQTHSLKVPCKPNWPSTAPAIMKKRPAPLMCRSASG